MPLDPGAEIDWTPVWSLTRQEPRYLPTAFCYFNAPQPDGEPFCIGDSNGNAAGNTLEEAVLQGFLELVERDAVALWWYNRVKRPEVDLDSFADPYLDRVRAYLRDRGRDLWVIDLTSDLKIPVFAALSRETDGREERIVPGFGAHLDPHVALMRAVTEMNQMLSNLPEKTGPPGARRAHRRPGDARMAPIGDGGQPALSPRRPRRRAPGCLVVSAVVVRRRRRGRPVVPGARRRAGDGDDGPGPDARGDRTPGGQGDRAGPAAFLGAIRTRPALRRAGAARLAVGTDTRGSAESDTDVSLTGCGRIDPG